MSEQSNQRSPWNRINLGSEKLKKFFLKHLDRIYTAKLHLVHRLPSLAAEAEFSELKQAIDETVQAVEQQVARILMIYALLDSTPNSGSINGLTGMIDDAFMAINEQHGEPELQDLSIIFYLQNIESVEMSSFQILQMAAVGLKNRQVSQLLKENYDEAKSDRILLLLISSKYIVS